MPIHSILNSVAQPLERGYKNYYFIIQGASDIRHRYINIILTWNALSVPALSFISLFNLQTKIKYIRLLIAPNKATLSKAFNEIYRLVASPKKRSDNPNIAL